jgi:hypothetical protein
MHSIREKLLNKKAQELNVNYLKIKSFHELEQQFGIFGHFRQFCI